MDSHKAFKMAPPNWDGVSERIDVTFDAIEGDGKLLHLKSSKLMWFSYKTIERECRYIDGTACLPLFAKLMAAFL